MGIRSHSRFGAFVLVVVILGIACVSPAGAQTITKDIKVTRTCTVGGQTITAGNYTVSFADDQDGQLVISKGSREVAKANYKLLKLFKGAADSALVFTVAADGSYRISRIEFKGYKLAIDVQ